MYAAPANDANSITADALIRNVAITDNTVYQKYPTGTLSSYVPSTKPATYPASAIPQGLAIDIYGSLYYAMYSGSTGTFVSKVLDGTGVANAFVASVGGPFAVAIGGLWNVYIGETYGSQTGPSTYMPGKITKCTYSSSTYTCAAIGVISTATASNPYWYYPAGIAVDSNSVVYVADNGNTLVRTIAADGVTVSTLASKTSVPVLNDVIGVAVDASFNVYVSQRYGYNILKFPLGSVTGYTTITSGTYGIILQSWPDLSGNLYFGDSNGKIWRVAASTGTLTSLRFANGATLGVVGGIAVHPSGVIYIADQTAQQIKSYTPLGLATTTTTSALVPATVYSDESYYYTLFKISGTFTPSFSGAVYDILVVGGGGGGGGGHAGGGGAGGVLTFVGQSLTAGTAYTVTVGGGGSAGASSMGSTFTGAQGGSGGASSFGSLTAAVGGGGGGSYSGGSYTTQNSGLAGGSGGGGGPIGGTAGAATSGQGYAGGAGSNSGGVGVGGGGGGAGGAGGAGSGGAGGTAGTGGAAVNTYSTWGSLSGLMTACSNCVGSGGSIAGGGGGGAWAGTIAAPGGGGGAGSGSKSGVGYGQATAGSPATANSGSGGGGGPDYNTGGGAGGSGFVVVRYPIYP